MARSVTLDPGPCANGLARSRPKKPVNGQFSSRYHSRSSKARVKTTKHDNERSLEKYAWIDQASDDLDFGYCSLEELMAASATLRVDKSLDEHDDLVSCAWSADHPYLDAMLALRVPEISPRRYFWLWTVNDCIAGLMDDSRDEDSALVVRAGSPPPLLSFRVST